LKILIEGLEKENFRTLNDGDGGFCGEGACSRWAAKQPWKSVIVVFQQEHVV
jgi:hypothetical protein